MAQRSRPPALESETGSAIAWRVDRLLAAGFERELASRLASNSAVDLHTVLELVDQGCRPDLAARILAPLEDEGRPG